MGAAHHELAAAARIPVGRIRVHPRNIRSKLTRIESLARSIRAEGVLQPLVVHKKFGRKPGVQDLELIAGHRRLAAAEIAGLATVPCIVLPQMTDDEAILAMLGENTQRRAVPGADLARAIRTLRVEFHYSSQAIADRLGVSVDEVQALGNGSGQDDTADAGADDPTAPRPEPRAGRLGPGSSRHPAAPPPRVHRQAVTPPQVGAKRVHDLLAEHDRGNLTAEQVVTRLRGALGGWEPAVRQARGPDSEREADHAEVAGLLDGSRTAHNARAAAVRAAVRKLDDGTRSAKEIGVQLGISQRQVVRHRVKAS